RAEAMKIILEASGKDIPAYLEENSEFKDIKLKDWYAKYVIYAAKNGIVNGYEDGTFGPNKPITRAEVAKIASLMLKGNVVSMVLEMMNN
ncbi:S-layer homology domain-containing protein, partial [Candidatus Gracilibacteria bacterium]|nr:S-layer homology domain-containing protein [Candidatus Gracilibacteria bacterium]